MSQNVKYTDQFLKSINRLTGIPVKKIQAYAKDNNPFNILEHPMVLEPSGQQLEKINKLNEFISNYNLLKIEEEQKRIRFTSSSEAGRYFVSVLGGVKDKERFMVAFLDNSNSIIEAKTVSEGSVGSTYVYPREILKMAMANDCSNIILAHNHPGLNTQASKQDQELTQRMVDIFTPLDINILDHIIVGGSKFSSMAQDAYLPTLSSNRANYETIEIKMDDSLNETVASFDVSFGNM